MPRLLWPDIFKMGDLGLDERELANLASSTMPHSTAETNGETNGHAGGFRVEEHWHSDPGDLRVICVGAGAAGLLVAYKMKKLFSKYELVVYDKNPSVAGTWYENRYPGCACDV
jgi:hypothetical protein